MYESTFFIEKPKAHLLKKLEGKNYEGGIN